MANRIEGNLIVDRQRFALVVSRFNDFISSKLVAGATDALLRHGCREQDITEMWVPGGWELPIAAKRLAVSGKFDGIVALGCVIRGHTPHFDVITGELAKGLAHVSMETGVPVSMGVVTADTLEQAIERAGSKMGNKGADAALAAIEMANVLGQVPKTARKKG